VTVILISGGYQNVQKIAKMSTGGLMDYTRGVCHHKSTCEDCRCSRFFFVEKITFGVLV